LPWLLRTLQSSGPLKLIPRLWTLLRFIAALMTLHFLDVSAWAEFYFRQHCFPGRETAYYSSLTSYTTVGYGDVVISHAWRLLGGWKRRPECCCFGGLPHPLWPSSSASGRLERGSSRLPGRKVSYAERSPNMGKNSYYRFPLPFLVGARRERPLAPVRPRVPHHRAFTHRMTPILQECLFQFLEA
jgi:hypothetical protein